MGRVDELLREYYGEDATFREGQREAIEAVIDGKRTLVVQKTGWGKSLVYFMATKILREEKEDGITLIISPLLALMSNQIDSAQRFGLNVVTINSENADNENLIMNELCNGNTVDALIISPERLSNQDFLEKCLQKIAHRISLFVVDEAHCISDWGHDFRPDYRRIVDIVHKIPNNVPILATTATANDRVVKDIALQLGEDLVISRGELIRESLAIQIIKLEKKEDRLAWLAENIEKIPGTGVIYCLTLADCDLVTAWLKKNNISCECYYSATDKDKKPIILEQFQKNEIKVLVATIAFGMGYDKPDIGFVIHFQRPANIVSYYQQIGRAGRGIDLAYAIMLCGEEDLHILKYFIDSAFPTEKNMNGVVKCIEENPGLNLSGLLRELNIKRKRLDSCLKYLEVSGDIYKDDKKYYKTAKIWKPDVERSEAITAIRVKELQDLNDYIHYDGCYMDYIAEKLDDVNAKKCGKCANCCGKFFDEKVSDEKVNQAREFMKKEVGIIKPRKTVPVDLQCKEGRVLSNYADAVYGKMVKEGKYLHNYFSDELVDASADILHDFVREHDIKWITPVTSLRHPDLVPDFAKRLAAKLGIGYFVGIRKLEAEEQKMFENSERQKENAEASFVVFEVKKDNILLVDDMVDSRWTFTICGKKMREQGSGEIYPFALANTAGRSDG